jgi:hypothetical protein
MKSLKKISYFTRVEDKFVFRVSTAFWHILIGILTLAAIIGVLLLAWSIIPPTKKQIKATEYPAMAPYPPVKEVTLADLKGNVEQPVPQVVEQAPPPQMNDTKAEPENDPDKAGYDLSLSVLKKNIPHDQWQSGYWSYPLGEIAWQTYHTEKYRQWIPSGDNMEQKLDRSFQVIHINKYAEKRIALNAYLKIILQVAEENKGEILNSIINNMNDKLTDIQLLDTTFTCIAENVKQFTLAQKETTQKMIEFVTNNPNSTFDFIPFAIQTCQKFPDQSRYQILTALTSEFYNAFNRNAKMQKEATDQFNNLLPQLKVVDPVQSLIKFYAVYNQKNRERNEVIRRINDEYNTKVAVIVADSTMRAMQAEAKFLADKNKKSELRTKSFYVIGGGFLAMALLGTILTLLSIQRILKRMELSIESRKS